MTKEERAAEALRKRQEEVEALRKQQEEERKRRQEFNRAVEEASTAHRSRYEAQERDRRREREADRERERERDRERERERDRERGDRDRDNDRDRRKDKAEDTQPGQLSKDREKESEAIRERYLGLTKKKRRVRRLNDRKFVFDWDASEDTSVDYNSLYKERHQVSLDSISPFASLPCRKELVALPNLD